jgi:translocon-associated protein subunit gamma
MAPKAGSKVSKEDELLMQSFTKNVSGKSSALFYGNALIVSAIPVWIFWRIHAIDPVASALLFIAVTLGATWLNAFAYRNTKHQLKHKVAIKREPAVSKEINQISDQKISRKEKDERILWKKNEVAEYEATTFSIFYNNALFLAILIFTSFYIFKGLSPHINYVVSMGLSSGAIALLSTGSKI